MSSREQRRMRKFYLSFLSNLRKWLVNVGSPFRISRKFIRNLMRQGLRTSAQAGFILPTVVFVTVATTLLVLAVVARSADRAQTAANARVEQVFEVAAAPIIDRARSKIEALINDDNLPRTTPSEGILDSVIGAPVYTYRDETRLQIVHDFGSRVSNATTGNPDNTIEVSDADIADREFVNTAWKFPIDTDNNGLFDTYGLYSILFRTRPPALADGNNTAPNPPDRPLVPLEARTLPFEDTGLSGLCAGATGVRVATNEGWTTSGNRLRKAFYVYTATVPITDPSSFPTANTSNFDNPANFETYRGIASISALELQQDRARNPVNNNAAWFEGDMELARPARFNFNGRIYVGGSLLIGELNNTDDFAIRILQVSSSGTNPNNEDLLGSCYYERANAEINIAGNVVEGDALTDNRNLTDATIDLYKGQGVRPDVAATPTSQPTIGDANQTVTQTANLATLNEFEFNRRVNLLVDAAIARSALSNVTRTGGSINLVYSPAADADPPAVQTDLKGRVRDEGIFGPGVLANNARRKALEVYFRARLAKVPYQEVPFGAVPPANPGDFPFTPIPIPVSAGGGNDLAPPFSWAIPGYTNGGVVSTGVADYNLYDGEGLRQQANTLTLADVTNPVTALPTIGPEALQERQNVEQFLGDRMRVGNNLPVRWLLNNGTTTAFVGESEQNKYTTDDSIKFNDPNNVNAGVTGTPDRPRYRNTRAASLDNLGETGRGGFWELSAADDPSNGEAPPNPSPTTGGLRVITNAGIFSARPGDTFLPRFYTGFNDDPLTTNIDESAAPLWNGRPQDNPITVDGDNLAQPLNEATFAAPDPTPGDGFNELNYVVWPDSMPMSGAIVYVSDVAKRFLLPNNTTVDIVVPATDAGYYPQAPNGLPTIDGTDTGIRVDSATALQRSGARALANRRGNLQMRASAVYHYKASVFNPETGAPQRPIACVSSYLDNSTPLSARNRRVNSGGTFVDSPWNFNAEGRSNNGLVYSAASLPASGLSGVPAFDVATQKFSIADPLAASNPYDATQTIANRLAYQANLVYPNGRFVNETLRNTLRQIAGGATTLSITEQSTLDANICALQIMDGTTSLITASADIANFTVNGAAINLPQGAIKESAFLDARELKSLNRNESLVESGFGTTGGLIPTRNNRADIYDLEIEQRQPLEVRVTDLDIDRLRGATVTGGINTGVPTEFMLPYSGLIYASREDALEDLSYYDNVTTPERRFEISGGTPIATALSKRRALSSTDFLVDPTRKVSGVRLINGYRLWRTAGGQSNLDDPSSNILGNLTVSGTTQPNFTDATRGEKGLILVSDVPTYIRAQRVTDAASGITPVGFNVHTQEEFNTALSDDLTNFYTRVRSDLNQNFACRPQQTATCTVGDQWRPATVLADAVTVLSGQWRDGYRSDGDFDLRNNANTSTSINWQTTLNSNAEKNKDSFYVVNRRQQGFFNNNFVTSANYLAATNSDGGTGSTSNNFPRGNRNSYNANGVTPVQRRADAREFNMEVCRRIPLEDCGFDRWEKVGAGTTNLYESTTNPGPVPAASAEAARPEFVYPQDRRYARRVSFLRYDDIYGDGNKALVFASTCPNPGVGSNSAFPIPINVDLGGDNAQGITVPQVLGNLNTPFGTQQRRLYGDVACPPSQGTTIEITGDRTELEGRLRNNTTGLGTGLTPPTIDDSNYSTQTVNAPGADSVIPFSRFLFDVRVNNLASASGNVTANIAVTNAGTATRGTTTTIPNSNISDNSVVDVIQRVYVDNGGGNTCRDATGAAIAPGTVITSVVFRPTGNNVCRVAVLVTRDIMDEGNETFQLQLSAPSSNATLIPAGTTRTGTIRQNTGGTGALIVTVNNQFNVVSDVTDRIGCPRPTPDQINTDVPTNLVTGTVTQAPEDDGITNRFRTDIQNFDRSISRSASNCPPAPTPGPGGGGGGMLPPPVFGLLPTPITIGGSNGLMTVGAAYPFPTGDYTGDRANRACNNQTVRGYSCNANPPGILTKNPSQGIGNSLFGERIAPQPLDPDAATPASGNGIAGSGIAPMIPGATQDRNISTDTRNKALWFRYTSNDNDPIGTESRLRYNRDTNIMVYSHAWPSISNSDSNTGNLNHGTRLVLPDTVCITTTGFVDARCLTQTPETQGTTTVPANLANLNLPYNPHFPSDQASATGTSTVIPASSYLICGVTGSARGTQAIAGDFTTTACTGANERTVINTFRTRLVTAAGAGISIDGGLTGTGTTADPFIFTATNTFADNRINVIDLNALDVTSGGDDGVIGGDVIFRANRNANGVNLGPSPVFILRTPTPEDLTLRGLRVKLDGVDPNNIFWLIEQTGAKALTIVGDRAQPSVIPGNFIGVMPASGGDFTNSSGLNIGRTLAADGTAPDNGSENGAFDAAIDNNAIYVTFRGSRFLGFRALTNTAADSDATSPTDIGINPSIVAAAMTSVNQPILLPVLQIHAPADTTANNDTMPEPNPAGGGNGTGGSVNVAPANRFTESINGANNGSGGQWTMRATPVANNGNDAPPLNRVEVNVYSVAGNTPSRSGVSFTTNYRAPYGPTGGGNTRNTAETGGGLHNFVRLLESWSGVPLKIAGGFLQNTRSRYAVGPFSQTFPYTDLSVDSADFRLDFSPDIKTLWINPLNSNTANFPLSRFRNYGNSVTSQNIPFYSPPVRLFGFDVGILTQTADLFASRFSTAIPNPDEFYRETDAEDRYVRQLLCALEPATVNDTTRLGAPPNTYTSTALKGKDLPNDCATVLRDQRVPGSLTFPNVNYN